MLLLVVLLVLFVMLWLVVWLVSGVVGIVVGDGGRVDAGVCFVLGALGVCVGGVGCWCCRLRCCWWWYSLSSACFV